MAATAAAVKPPLEVLLVPPLPVMPVVCQQLQQVVMWVVLPLAAAAAVSPRARAVVAMLLGPCLLLTAPSPPAPPCLP